MAAINIYVPEELASRMKSAAINWSEVARKAFEYELIKRQREQSYLRRIANRKIDATV